MRASDDHFANMTIPMMSKADILLLNSRIIQTYVPPIRFGQATYNALRELRPDIAGYIVNTDNDPFYDDSKLENFWKFLSKFIRE